MALSGSFEGAVVLDPQKLADLLRSENGPAARRLMEDGQIVKAGAQSRVGVYVIQHAPGDERLTPRSRRPGTLRDSIVTRFVQGGAYGFEVLVGSEDEVALLHHEGTVAHSIQPRVKRVLAFVHRGAVRIALRVSHPGTRPNRYLTEALEDLRGRY